MIPAAVASTEQSDSDLARRAAGGDQAAFQVIMRRYNRMLFRTARSILWSDSDAEDALQEAYLQAYQGLDHFRGDSRLSTWLTRIVINQALERRRKRRREGTLFESSSNIVDLEQELESVRAAAWTTEEPESQVLREELRKLLEAKIDRLPPAFRTVFVLRALEELSVEETAACLGIPEATVRTRFFRARSLLRESLEHTFDLALQEAFSFGGARCDRIVDTVLSRLLKSSRAVGPPH
jgi:RNA polymerase sigma-70 factor (ECF subfamily)